MGAENFYVEAGHIMMFARSIGDENPAFDPTRTDPSTVVAPPTFVQSSAHFDPDYYLRPKIGASGWFGSGGTPSGTQPDVGGESTGGRQGGGLHAEQHFEYHRPVVPGAALTARVSDGETWEKQSSRGGTLVFRERITEYVDRNGDAVVTARSVGVQVIEDGAS
ncbi:FAS1-like dehydratase domain-containing protein [Ilumatobacter nonamiensis]|uniref:FAS1-like dehydratase domain-containing protein n=1 Tax=Ilumatobacter nonamiensis TaxID=467093 RepID=UPI00034C88D9|nr:MaoC family dehydratase N-terminal domain-containing protein [Ilumatobacter nonamiensis]